MKIRKRGLQIILMLTVILQIFCLTVSAVAISVYPDVTLNVPIYTQEKDQWCWVAAAKMAGTYKYPSTTVTQTQIANYIKGIFFNNKPGSIDETADAINYVTNNTYAATTDEVWGFNKVRTSLHRDYPIVPLVNDGSSGHYYVICGIIETPAKIILNDPWTGRQTSCYFSHFYMGGDGTSWYETRPYAYTVCFEGSQIT